MIPAACMNAVRNPAGGWYHCKWVGDVEDLVTDECPRCGRTGVLAPRVDISRGHMTKTTERTERTKC